MALPIYRFFSLLLFSPLLLPAQSHTIGTLQYDPAAAAEGYNLFFPHRQGTVFLIDNCGQVVHHWPDNNWEPGEAVYLMEDGSLWVCKSHGDLSNPWIQAGGAGEKIEHRAWDNTLLWTYTVNDSLRRMHHDFQVLPNGNVVLIVWEWKTQAEALAQGRDSSLLPVGHLLPDYLLELQPLGLDSAIVAWEWHAWDHLIQDFDSTRANYGVIADHPERIDLNFTNSMSTDDWLHMNTLHYNPVLDMLMVSVPTFNEMWIIDHSTTTAEAATSTGGHSGRGGDLLYRWGNPRAYGRGTVADQKFFFQHDTHWLSADVGPTDPYYHSVGLFNNQVTPQRSYVNILTPVFDSATWSFDTLDGRWLPADFDWSYTTPVAAQMKSAVVSSMQRFPNGNTLIFAGRNGHAIEIDENENQVWEYIVPFSLGNILTQGDTVPPSGNLTFRMKRYAPDFPGFAGRDLSPTGYIEFNPDTLFCDTLFAATAPPQLTAPPLTIFPNPAADRVHLSATGTRPHTLRITDLWGRTCYLGPEQQEWELSLSHWPAGWYLVFLGDSPAGKLAVVH